MAKKPVHPVDNFIQDAIEHPGALRKRAKHEHLLGAKGDEKLSDADLNKLEAEAKKTDNTKLQRQVNLARTLRTFHH